MSENQEQLAELATSISEQVNKFIKDYTYNRGRPPVMVADPARAQEALLLFSTGSTQTAVCKKTGMDSRTLSNLRSEFADYVGQWRELGGKISGGLYMDASDKIGETMQRIAKAEAEGDWKAVEALSKSLQAQNKIVEVSHRQAMNARGEATQHIKVDKTATVEDVQKAAEDALKLIQGAEVIDVDES